MSKTSGFKIELEGADKLAKKLKKNIGMDHVKDIVKGNAIELNLKAAKEANFKKGYSTGTTKRSIRFSIEDAGLTGIVEPTTAYAPYLEWGTRRMAAQPFLKPAFDEQKKRFMKDMKNLMKWGAVYGSSTRIIQLLIGSIKKRV